MERRFDLVTFDCYGTLVDWKGGISGAFGSAAAAAGVQVDRDAVLEAHARIEPVVQAGSYRSYRDVLRVTACRMAEGFGWKLDPEDADFLPASLKDWEPFPDTGPALRRLVSAGCRLGILSNVDDDLLAGTLERIPVSFDMVITAEQVGSYKPSPGHFHEARRQCADRSWLHAAQSYFHDVIPATALGIPCAWINRGHERLEGQARPNQVLPTLAELADWVTS